MPATAGGENQRKLHEGHESARPRKLRVREQIRSRSAEHEDQGERDEVRLQRDPRASRATSLVSPSRARRE